MPNTPNTVGLPWGPHEPRKRLVCPPLGVETCCPLERTWVAPSLAILSWRTRTCVPWPRDQFPSSPPVLWASGAAVRHQQHQQQRRRRWQPNLRQHARRSGVHDAQTRGSVVRRNWLASGRRSCPRSVVPARRLVSTLQQPQTHLDWCLRIAPLSPWLGHAGCAPSECWSRPCGNVNTTQHTTCYHRRQHTAAVMPRRPSTTRPRQAHSKLAPLIRTRSSTHGCND